MLHGKKILIGVCGSIAAYKIAYLIRLLKKEGAEVKVIMTSTARDFITPLTLSTVSQNPVLIKFHDDQTGEWQSHISLGLWADIFLIAPASANTIAKMAHGYCDNLLLATYLSSRCPVFLAPAMDLDMYQHPSTVQNIKILSSYGNHVIKAEHGELASGLTGEGRMSDPENILKILQQHFKKKDDFKGLEILITAGPTVEKIDPVRFISNHSSGKMGYAIARELADRGASVTLISGPTHQTLDHKNVQKIHVTNADEMYDVSKKIYRKTDVAIFSAAVADYKPSNMASQKIKKEAITMDLRLEKNPDIAMELGKLKKNNQINIGFALETNNEIQNATLKLNKKSLDFIILNSIKDKGAGFSTDTNKITILDKEGKRKNYSLKSKELVARDIADYLFTKINDT